MTLTTSLEGQTALVTGGTDGIGKETALRLAQRGAQVILVGRSASKGSEAIAALNAAVPGSSIRFLAANLAHMRDVQQLAVTLHEQLARLDIVVHCAGLMLSQRTLTEEGIETVFAVQYLARQLLTGQLIDLLRASPRGRVVDVSAGGTIDLKFDFDNLQGEKFYGGVHAMRHESVANDMLILELQQRYPDLWFYNYGPGYVTTTLLRDMPFMFRQFANIAGLFIGITAEQAADDILTLLTGELEGGLYSRKAKRNTPSALKADPANRQRLWQRSEQWINDALKTTPVQARQG
ncbi:MAG: SDR family NAD(P)-dependent oxidoreductase [Anaerolineae bacterium]|nr:SDR family NAD(P)-dependent oxidoreductase [Anaerolineae bacterium]